MDANALHTSTSPYLQSHAHQPVNWHMWGPEAFELARARNVSVLVSIGYSTCHWCHVMARESFSDVAVAKVLNDNFVAIKIDREELPHVDEFYMNALQALRGQGGWPLNAFTDHQGVPFFAGTYFPSHTGRGLPTFIQVLQAVTNTWRDQQEQISAITHRLRTQLVAVADSTTASVPEGELANLTTDQPAVPADELTAWSEQLADRFDPVSGGFGGAPKFPPSMVLQALMQRADFDDNALTMVRITLHNIATGGMRDQLRGGIARYSTDAQWHVPHFEKMLNDNAAYLSAAAAWWTWEHTRDPHSAHTEVARAEVVATARFLLADMRLPGGGLATALDADSPLGSESVEGAFYTFTRSQVEQALAQVADASDYFALVEFPHSGAEAGEPRCALIAPGRGSSGSAAVQPVIEHLRALQETRTPPKRDNKLITEDACRAAVALVHAGLVLSEPELVDAGATTVQSVLDNNRAGERLLRSTTDGKPGPGVAGLADYAALIRALLELHQVVGVGSHELTRARLWPLIEKLFDTARGLFVREGHVHDHAPDVLVPASGANPADSVVPCGRTAFAEVALLVSVLSPESGGEADRVARGLLVAGRPFMQSTPRAAGWQAYVAMRMNVPRVSTRDPDLARIAYAHPSQPVVDTSDDSGPGVAVVCVGTRCLQPATDAQTLREQLDALSVQHGN
ncbi:thioredoxin domain-containing protein [Brevibacterium paucivorans]